MLLASPDGSLRALSDSTCLHVYEPHASFAIEIKCPFPGSIYKPKIHYEMLFYYVPQILCEMAALNTNTLLYICYSTESTTLLVAEFDSDLWEVIVSDMLRLYRDVDWKCPTKLSPELKDTKEKLKEYEGCSNKNASSFITFFTFMLRQNVIPFQKELFVAFKMARNIK